MSLRSPDLMKQNNKRKILEIIYKRENIYRAQIAEMTNMSNQTITNLVKELIQEGMLEEVTLEKKAKGRNPMALSITRKSLYVIGAELSVSGLKVGVYDLNMNVISELTSDLKNDNLKLLKSLIDTQIDEMKDKKFIGIGLSVEGIVDEKTGLIIKSKDLGLNGVDLNSELAYLNMPVQIKNDVNMLAETDSKKHHEKNYLLVKLDNGIGAALVTNGMVLQSANNTAGEFGHMTIYGLEKPETCKCGKEGCLTTVASASAIEKSRNMLLSELKEAFSQKESNTLEYVNQILEYISRPMSNLITFLDLEGIILTGKVVEAFKEAFETVFLEKLKANLCHWHGFNDLKILEDYDMTKRCARCAMENFFIGMKGEGEY